HIVCDAWSLDVIVRELVAAYDAHVRGEAPALPPLSIHYKDFAAWQHERLSSPAAAAHRAYWREKLASQLPVLDLPTDRPRPAAPSWEGRTVLLDLGAELRDGLARIGAAQRASVFAVLVALAKTWLLRLAGQEDLVVGVPVAGRDHLDLENQ